MIKEETKTKFEKLFQQYYDKVVGEVTYAADDPNNHRLRFLGGAYDEGLIDDNEYIEMSQYVLNEMLKEFAETYVPLKDRETKGIRWKAGTANPRELRKMLEAAIQRLYEIEEYVKFNVLDEKKERSLTVEYQLRMALTPMIFRELANRNYKLSDIVIY